MDDGTLGEGALLKLATIRFDSLEALRGGGEGLEMSDLKPVDAVRDTPFPFSHLDGTAPPDLVFEIYNLTFGPDDLTHYTIEYEVSRAARRSPEVTRARSSHSGTDVRSVERIALDLGEWREGGAVVVTVRLTDDVTSEQVARSIAFELDTQ